MELVSYSRCFADMCSETLHYAPRTYSRTGEWGTKLKYQLNLAVSLPALLRLKLFLCFHLLQWLCILRPPVQPTGCHEVRVFEITLLSRPISQHHTLAENTLFYTQVCNCFFRETDIIDGQVNVLCTFGPSSSSKSCRKNSGRFRPGLCIQWCIQCLACLSTGESNNILMGGECQFPDLEIWFAL